MYISVLHILFLPKALIKFPKLPLLYSFYCTTTYFSAIIEHVREISLQHAKSRLRLMETKGVLFFYSGYWNGHGEGCFPTQLHPFHERTTSLLLQHQPQLLRRLKEIIIWLIMTTLHKKLSWYESDKSSMVSCHVNYFQSLLYTGNRAGDDVTS